MLSATATHPADHPLEAMTRRRFAGADDLLCITGSVFLAGELRPHLVG